MRQQTVIVNVNVAITTNGRAAQASQVCQLACIDRLRLMQAKQRVVLDTLQSILQEHRRHLSARGQPGVGDAFFKWLWSNAFNPEICTIVSITPSNNGREFAEFPDDPDLARFDRSDRKYVAVAIAHPDHPPIINAVDSDRVR